MARRRRGGKGRENSEREASLRKERRSKQVIPWKRWSLGGVARHAGKLGKREGEKPEKMEGLERRRRSVEEKGLSTEATSASCFPAQFLTPRNHYTVFYVQLKSIRAKTLNVGNVVKQQSFLLYERRSVIFLTCTFWRSDKCQCLFEIQQPPSLCK